MSILNKIFSKIKNIRTINDIVSIAKTLIFGHLLKKKIAWNIAYIRESWKKDFNKKKNY